MKLAQLSGAAALTLASMTGIASADPSGMGMPADCGGCTVTVFFNNAALGAPPLPAGFTPLNLGTSPGNPNNFQSAGTILNPGGGISSIMFPTAGNSGPPVMGFHSGEYAGNIASVASSPFGSGDSTTNYLLAQANGGSVQLNYLNPQTSFDLVWGTVDSLNNQNLLSLTLALGSSMLTGMDIANIITTAGGTFTQGAQNVSVLITGLPTFTTITASDQAANSAFEFDPLLVPAPLIGHGLLVLLAVGGVLFGSKFLESLKKHHLHAA